MNSKPRVLQICHDYKGPFRSVARQYAGCFADCDVTTLFLRGPRSQAIESSILGDVQFLHLDAGALRGLKIEPVRLVKSIVESDPPDLVIAHRYKPFYIAQILNYQLDIGAVIGVMHEYGFLKRFGRSLMSRFWKDNVHLIGVSRPVCDEVRHTRPRLANRIHLVQHCIEAPTLVDPVTARHELGIPLGRYCIGTIGRLVSKKNHRLLLEGFARLDTDALLAIVGEGEMQASLEQLAKQLKISDRVIFCGHHDDARRYMKAFDAFVLSSNHHEAFAMVLLEAMAASVPVVTTDAPGPASVVGDSALLFVSDDASDLARQLTVLMEMSRADIEQMTERALRRLGEEYSVMKMMERIRNLEPVIANAPLSL
jgi:glycosyltransferase involved in cell wall biosynthesis